MQDNEIQPTVLKTIRMDAELIEKINELKKGTERNFSQQIKFMLKKYIEIIETK